MFKKVDDYLLKIIRYVVWFNWLVYEFIELHNQNVGTVIDNLCGGTCSGDLPLDYVKTGITVEILLISSIGIYIILLVIKYIKSKNFKDYFINIVSLVLGIIMILAARLMITGVQYGFEEYVLLKKFRTLVIILLIAGFIYDRARIKKINN